MKQVKNVFGGVILGILFIVGSTILLWWNEGNTVRNIKTTDAVEKEAITVSSTNLDPANNTKLVLTTGDLNVVKGIVTDTEFNVSTATPTLNRKVEMFVWEENEHVDSDSDRKTYTYEKDWSSSPVNSASFHEAGHVNPASFPYQDKTTVSDEVKVGDYYLTSSQLTSLPTRSRLNILDTAKLPAGYTIQGGYITNSKDLASPEIGDVRISFTFNDYKSVTILAVQSGNTFTDYVSDQGKTVNRIDEGILTKAEVVEKMREENNSLKWILRGVGAFLLILGYLLVLSPLTRVTSRVPFIGGVVGSAVTGIGFLVGIGHACLVIGIAWLRFRPLLGGGLLVVVLLSVLLIRYLVKNNQGETQTNTVNNNMGYNQMNNPVNTPINNSVNNQVNSFINSQPTQPIPQMVTPSQANNGEMSIDQLMMQPTSQNNNNQFTNNNM